ncbi:nucleotidyltransferase substrate binding protein, HI0074 family [Methanococcus maripaludis C5]|jgi:nucleotidyltransferase substrate binding protein (TIGR01987 family)|uniref:Nucleotidyltransferase substrate binding protein, HI0074 family n=3 Tax=Methanococcus maripaludis TaxID=39152 RepID=A4FXK2_METM5|nr:HI0074 family nucleotidyltransferase substrate-binding subunit [Methanococcus maripaludis]ABO34936.1 nucleotidyltransferase substrate binding protein, HI0074 family [Methanococcus maripaludis C5]MDK2929410.1 hypothetical protein [Methanococcus sp.]BAP60920.1 hypothetical protein MMKA1_08030 [Methanococcus maripaludis KA1]BAP62881.1 hypothetical protein MMOS7_07950 [Methanococcus maripaludis OS7]
MDNKLEKKLENFKNALDWLDEGLKLDSSNSIIIDGVIHRFEICYEFAFKTIKYFLNYQDIGEVKSPRIAFEKAFAYGIIENLNDWIDMLNDKNKILNQFDEKLTKKTYNKIKSSHFKNLKNLYDIILKKE